MSLVMVHPDVDATAEVVSERQFEKVWAGRGWELLDEPHAYASRLLGKKVTKLADLKADELERLAKSRRLEPGANKAESEKLFKDSFAAPEAAEQPQEKPAEQKRQPAPGTTPKAPAATNQNQE